MSDAPERIWAQADPATVYMDGSSPLTARDREFRGAVEYVRADLASPTPSLPEDVARVVEQIESELPHDISSELAGKALALIQSLSSQLAEVRAERDEAKDMANALNGDVTDFGQKLEAVEADRDHLAAENERLREALEKLLRLTVFELGDNAGKEPWTRNIERARAALAGKAGEA